jgi:hypothetical protein
LATAKDLLLKPITAADANRIVRSLHYSGKVVNNSQVHLGVFLDGRCGGALQFGPSLDKRKLVGLVEGTKWNEFIELNRMALADWLPHNGESRSLAVAMRILRKSYPWLKWVVTFADGAQCGDGTIYRAAGFVLTSIKRNDQIWQFPGGEIATRMVATDTRRPQRGRLLKSAGATFSRGDATKGGHIKENGAASMRPFIDAGAKPIPGFQLRYLYFLDPTARERLTVPVLPYARIAECGAGMYRGKPRVGSAGSGTPAHQAGGGGANPTPALSSPQED